MFTIEERERVCDRVLELAHDDPRIVSGAILGSLALGPGDRWSDLDLSFAVADGSTVDEVLADWTRTVESELAGVHLFDLARGRMIYRVFLLPGLLQFDLSLGPEAEFGARGPKFKLLFGTAAEVPQIEPDDAHELFGLSVHHALRARFCIERGKLWEAQYWLNELRDHALALACRRRGLETRYGGGYQDLPPEVLAGFEDTLVRSIDRDELLRALGRAVDRLLLEADEVRELASKVEASLRDLADLDAS
ncbi:MAG: nucleotidyltransferase domain-containing protein [Gaiellaceae bacterium]